MLWADRFRVVGLDLEKVVVGISCQLVQYFFPSEESIIALIWVAFAMFGRQDMFVRFWTLFSKEYRQMSD